MANRETLPLTSNHWGTYRVETENGKVKALHSFEHDDDVSPIGQGIIDVLTLDKGTSRLAQGPIAHSCLVEVELYEEDLPDLTAFDPPPITESI